ncbi:MULTISPECIES: mechanosensitive ion channel [Exiguobacterium]|uniref:Conserved TM helix repeat-containing protein n=1 Tax=Exiguobacterium sp. (strain ATCC BAA-1283 / AT1b) TaxID=360911 RepID=C4L0B1_EXISA|nr:mechanosensitive ion channel [Exiguobacterium sp. AT1b]ACQ70774.1 Conserved TM helix repeat-containing protein [Exiguobacterium sp. AT1b]
MNNTTYNFNTFMSWLPELLLAIVILVVGYILAKVLENVTRKALKKARLDERAGIKKNEEKGEKWTPERIIGKVVFFGVLLLAFLIIFEFMNVPAITEPFSQIYEGFSGLIIGVIKAGLILLVAWVIATLLKKGIQMAGHRLNLSKLMEKTGQESTSVNQTKWVDTVANIVFYLVLLLALPAVLDALGLRGVSGPFEDLLNSFLGFIPKLVAAALIFAIGYVVAKIVRDILTKFLEAAGLDRLAERFHLSDYVKGSSLAKAIGTIVFIFIMIPVTISALEALDIRGISEPAIAMLNDVLVMIPDILVAIVLVLVGVFVAKWLKGVVVSLLENLGVNSLAQKMGFGERASSMSIAQVVGVIVQVIVILLFVSEALQVANLEFMASLATAIFAYLPMVIAALIILAVGFWLANMAERLVGSVLVDGAGQPSALRYVAKYAILGLVFFMAISQLGIAPMIVNTAFLLILGAVALAFGLAFGLGGRETAARYLKKAEQRIDETEVSKEGLEQEKEQMSREAEAAKQQAKQGVEQSKHEAEQSKHELKRDVQNPKVDHVDGPEPNPFHENITPDQDNRSLDDNDGPLRP